MTIVETSRPVVGGVDTHLEVHVAAALDAVGGLLGVRSFPTTPAGYHALSCWLGSLGVVERVGSKAPALRRGPGPTPRGVGDHGH
jgi:hypothetical protein